MKRLAPGDRPREKLARAGSAALGDNELVALVLGSGTPARDALTIAGDLLERAGGTGGLSRVGLDDLMQLEGVGATRASRLLAAIELGRRVLTGRTASRPRLGSPQEAGHYLLPLFGGHPVERFGLVLLDAKHRLRRTVILSVGSLDTSIVHPREVFREATVGAAAALILFHNHPSGDPHPSTEDVLLTRRLVRAGELMGIEVIDHIILGDGRWFSFKESSRL